MKKINKDNDEYLMKHSEFFIITLSKNWIDKFKDGDIIRFTDSNTVYEIATQKVARLI